MGTYAARLDVVAYKAIAWRRDVPCRSRRAIEMLVIGTLVWGLCLAFAGRSVISSDVLLAIGVVAAMVAFSCILVYFFFPQLWGLLKSQWQLIQSPPASEPGPLAKEAEGEVFCPGCGHLNARTADFCTRCMAPLSVHATTDPVKTIFAEGYAARRALTQPPKPIIVVGVWVWMLPIATVSLLCLVASVVAFVYGLETLQSDLVIESMLTALPSGVLLFISATILYRVTREARRARGLLVAERAEDDAAIKCLACGQLISSDASACPACGWSYSP